MNRDKHNDPSLPAKGESRKRPPQTASVRPNPTPSADDIQAPLPRAAAEPTHTEQPPLQPAAELSQVHTPLSAEAEAPPAPAEPDDDEDDIPF